MGWYFSRQSKADLVQELIAPQESHVAGIKVIAYTLSGDVLWSVVEFTAKRPNVHPELEAGESLHFIRCDLLQSSGGEWGYKPMDESMHPYYYSCPMSYLDMAPERSREWREGVRAYHASHRTTTLTA